MTAQEKRLAASSTTSTVIAIGPLAWSISTIALPLFTGGGAVEAVSWKKSSAIRGAIIS